MFLVDLIERGYCYMLALTGNFGMPLGIARNFLINGREVLVPMTLEEPSVVASASFMAKLARAGGGFIARTTEPEMIGQIQLLDLADLAAARLTLLEAQVASGTWPYARHYTHAGMVRLDATYHRPFGMRWQASGSAVRFQAVHAPACSAASASPTTCPASWPSSPATTRSSSPAR